MTSVLILLIKLAESTECIIPADLGQFTEMLAGTQKC